MCEPGLGNVLVASWWSDMSVDMEAANNVHQGLYIHDIIFRYIGGI